jgi:hypothetical protein
MAVAPGRGARRVLSAVGAPGPGKSAWVAHLAERMGLQMLQKRASERPRFLFRRLRSRGVSVKAAAGAAFSGRDRWFCSNHSGLTRAYPAAWFIGRLVSLATRWDELNTRVQASGQLVLPF